MIYFSDTLKRLRDAIDSFIKVIGTEDVPIGTDDTRGGLDQLVTLDLVYVDANNNIVGDEANDYRPKDGERAAVRVS
jgi:hypothetical protein